MTIESELNKLKMHQGFAYVTTTNNEKIIIDCSSIDYSPDGIFFIGLILGELNTYSVDINCIASVNILLD